MRKICLVAVTVSCTACSSSNENEIKRDEQLSLAEQNAIFARVGHTINNGRCYEKNVDTKPIIKLDATRIRQGEIFSGKAYYATTYFTKLARCYKFVYKPKLSISNILTPIEAQAQNQDTVAFKVSPDSLVRINQGKREDMYELRARLRASFSDGVSGYDTTGPATTIRLFVIKP